MISIINYGAGNLHSVQNALNFLGAESIITQDPEEILSKDKIILPGVGSFGDAMKAIRERNLEETIKKAIDMKKPFLGICLGLQLLFEESRESPGVPGLGIFPGKIVKIPKSGDIKIPHMGWNSLEILKPSRILKDIGENPYVYFVHSYYLETTTPGLVSAKTTYGEKLSVAVEDGNVFATQFHPEKSGDTGLKILENFLKI